MTLEKTQGIVLGLYPYNDRTSFAHIYTRRFGRVSYSVPVPRTKRAKLPKSLFAPFMMLDMEVEHAATREVQRIQEARIAATHYNLYTDPVKSAVLFFLAEMVSRTVREQEANPAFFDYLTGTIELFDLIEDGKANFHFAFLIGLADFTGIRIARETYGEGFFFDMMEGSFVDRRPMHPYFLAPAEGSRFHDLLGISFATLSDYRFTRAERRQMLDWLVGYFRLHLPNLEEIRSLEISSALFG